MELAAIKDPYATVWVAVYEPLILQWIGRTGLQSMFDQVLRRELSSMRRPSMRHAFVGGLIRPSAAAGPGGAAGPGSSAGVRPASPPGIARPQPGASPSGLSTSVERLPLDVDARREKIERIADAFDRVTVDEVLADLATAGVPVAGDTDIKRELSPLGIAHFFRQLYFDAGAGVGPIEQVIAVAPLENLEIVERRFRRRTFERIETHGLEQTSERSVEEQVVDEISETVQANISRDISVGISASAEGTIGVWSAGATANTEFATSVENARETAKRRMLGQTRTSAETVRRTVSVTVRTEEELGEEYSVRRVLRNESEDPVNYALRRVLRRVRVKLQAMGPRLVWQLYLCEPGRSIVGSRLVMYPEEQPVAPPGLPPDAPPRPTPVQESGVQTVGAQNGVITLAFPAHEDRVLKSVIITDVADASPEGKDPDPPVLLAPAVVPAVDSPTRATASIDPGSATRVMVSYTAHFEPSESALTQWNQQVEDARARFEAQQMEEQFERARRLIEAKRNIDPRPSADLRQEERYVILARMVEEGFGRGQQRGPSPVEIELFHRYFEVPAIFYYVHPAWWRPRHRADGEQYEITDQSRYAAFGSSLGWTLQLDGDRRRNEFLNSPWVRVCVPVRPGRERAAFEWLAEYVEGKKGFDLSDNSPAGKLLAAIEARRETEEVASPGPDYVTLSGEIAPDGESAADAWPIINEFEVLEPTEGFIYERIRFP